MGRVRVVAMVASLALGLAACGTDPPTPSPLAESTAPSAPPSSTAPSPQPWEARTIDGADAFVRHWFAVFNASLVSGDTRGLGDVSAPDCKECQTFIQVIRKQYADGGKIRSDGWRIRKLGITGKPPRLNVVLLIFQPREISDNPAPEPDVITRAGLVSYQVAVVWRDAWLMRRLSYEGEG